MSSNARTTAYAAAAELAPDEVRALGDHQEEGRHQLEDQAAVEREPLHRRGDEGEAGRKDQHQEHGAIADGQRISTHQHEREWHRDHERRQERRHQVQGIDEHLEQDPAGFDQVSRCARGNREEGEVPEHVHGCRLAQQGVRGPVRENEAYPPEDTHDGKPADVSPPAAAGPVDREPRAASRDHEGRREREPGGRDRKQAEHRGPPLAEATIQENHARRGDCQGDRQVAGIRLELAGVVHQVVRQGEKGEGDERGRRRQQAGRQSRE